MRPSLPSFFRLPAHNVFHYEPRFYDPKKEEREKRLKRIRFRKKHFESNSPIYNSIREAHRKERHDTLMLSRIIRWVLLFLFFIMAYLLARYLGILVSSLY